MREIPRLQFLLARVHSKARMVKTHGFKMLVVACTLVCGCRVHTLLDGNYQFEVTEVLENDCELMSPPAGVQSAGVLRTEGHWVGLRFTEPDLQLVGTYLSGVEALTLDGSLSHFPAQLRGRSCVLDTVTFHLDGTTVDAQTFEGAMAVNYEARQPDECTCRYWFKYRATSRR